VQSDPQGEYLGCPHCKARIAMKRVTVNGRVGFRVE
jgi:DNA-directed RNA polymerase subunit RPC12/RpoP